MRALLSTFALFSLMSYSAEVVVKFKKTPISILKEKRWRRLAPQNHGRLEHVFVYKDPIKDLVDLKREIRSRFEVVYVEEFIQISSLSIEESTQGTFIVNDPLFKFQWGNQYNNQIITNEMTDLKDIRIVGNDKSDIGLINYNEIESLFSEDKKEIIVAVLDTGVDYNHPDLKANIALNKAECESGEIPFGPTPIPGDLYSGDCKGWNFTGKNKVGNNRPEDFVGHGTHIAGIISAVTNNSIGVAGLSNRIKILPVKILSSEPEKNQAVGTSERLVKGIEYAISRNVDVINLSLGWPISFDKGHLKDSIMDAIDQGITVVAAAGNNDHSAPIMPCSYERVICVGSNNPDTKMSDFSNFGAHVDVLAPGNNIMSTYPTAITPLFTDQNGYEIKSGTSQATPYVSLLAGVIKAIWPKISEVDLRGKIFASTRAYQEAIKFSNGHNINFDRTLKQNQGFYKPLFKGFNRVQMNREDLSFHFEIPIQPYLGATHDFDFKIVPLDGVRITGQALKDGANNRKLIEVKGQFIKETQKLLQKFKLILKQKEEQSEYFFEKRFYVDFNQVEGVRSFKIIGAPARSLTAFSTVNYYHTDYTTPYYYIALKSSRGMLYILFKAENNELKRIGVTQIKGAVDTLSLHILDSNNDSDPDVLIRSLVREENEGGKSEDRILYSYLGTDLKPLYGEKRSSIYLNFENTILRDLNNFSFYRSDHLDYGSILIPVYFDYREQLPKADRNPNPFSRLRNRSFSNRIYYYSLNVQKDSVEFITRTFNTNKFVDQLKKKIGFKPFQQIFVSKFKKQSLEDLRKGKVSFYLSLESERRLPKNYLVDIEDIEDGDWKLTPLQGPQVNFSNMSFVDAFDLTSELSVSHQYDLKTLAYEKVSKLSFDELRIKGQRNDFISLLHKDIFNPLEVPIKTFFGEHEAYRFFLTPSKIFLDYQSEKEQRQVSYPAHVSSFLPGALFREQYFPISLESARGKIPAFYVDATQIASRNIYLITYLDGQIVAPVKFNIDIPENCKALNPVVTDRKEFEYALQCFQKNGDAEIKFIPLKL